jgi:hypothetical protein
LTLLGSAQITGNTGTESLINRGSQTIGGSGSISNLANFTNSGTLVSSSSGGVNSLAVGANLTNWTAGTGELYAGNYIVNDGSTLQLSSLGSNRIQTLGDSALGQLSNINEASLTLNNNNFSINPGGTNGTLTLNAGTVNVNTGSLEVNGNLVASNNGFDGSSVNVNAGNLKVDGAMTNGGSWGGQAVNLTNNSTATVCRGESDRSRRYVEFPE